MIRAMRTAVLAVLVLGAATAWAEAPAPSKTARAALDAIAREVKHAVSFLDEATVHRMMAERYRTLRLMDEKGNWLVPELSAHSATLLPRRLDGLQLSGFVDVMADVATANPYVMSFLDAAHSYHFALLERKVKSEGVRVFPEVVVHAQVLERLTRAMIDDFKISEACRAHWRKVVDSDKRFWKAQNIFARIKTRSVNLGIDLFNRDHRKGEANPKTLGFTLPLNIMEAVGAELLLSVFGPKDARLGHLANARAGIELVRNGPHGAGPSTFSASGELIEINPRAVKSWDDLYATWNMCFVTMLGSWPYFMAKLVIPAVNDYAEEPGTYINRRALALEIHMYSNGLELASGLEKGVDWRDPELTAVWGKINRQAARDYMGRARATTP